MRRRMLLGLALIVGTAAGPRYLPLVSASQADLPASPENSQTSQALFPSAVLQPPDASDDSPPFFLDCPNTVIPSQAPKSEPGRKHKNLVEDSSQPLTPLTILVHVHAMYASEAEKSSRADGMSKNVSTALQEVQVAFANTTFTFQLSSVSHYVEPAYWDILVETNSTSTDLVGSTFGAAETAMVQKYHTGGRMDLNVYITDMRSKNAGAVLLGHAYFPWMCGVDGDERPDRLKLDGVILRSNWFNLGRSPIVQSQSFGQIMSHEIGHWCGLLHSFSPSAVGVSNGTDGSRMSLRTKCGDPWSTDYVGDTPEAFNPQPPVNLKSTSEMCTPVDTCPNQPGMDDIENIMSYSNCPNSRFTPGQVQRMENMVRRWRAFPQWEAMKTEMLQAGPGYDIMGNVGWSAEAAEPAGNSATVALRPSPWSLAVLPALLIALPYPKM